MNYEKSNLTIIHPASVDLRMLHDDIFLFQLLLLFIEFEVRVPVIEHKVPVLPLFADLLFYSLVSLLKFESNIVLFLHDFLKECLPFILNLLLFEHVLIVFF